LAPAKAIPRGDDGSSLFGTGEEDTMTMEDKFKLIGLFLTAAGLFLTAWQIYKARVQQRAQYLLDHFTAYIQEPGLADIFYRLQFGTFTYPEGFHNSECEVRTDRLLDHFNRIITLYEIGAVSKRDLRYMTHEFWVISRNESLQAYFAFLDGLHQEGKIAKRATFATLRRMAKLVTDESD
jgi:hypothetical protein